MLPYAGLPQVIFLKVTCFVAKQEKVFKEQAVGIDFGIATSLTLSTGEKHDVCFPVSKRTRRLQRRTRHAIRGSANYYKGKRRIANSILATTNSKKDKQNKIVSAIVNRFETIVVQQESIKSWQAGRYGRKINASGIGGIMVALKTKAHTLITVDKFFPSTQLCPSCSALNKHDLSQRVYFCACGYSQDRDVHAAQNILREGLKTLTIPMEYRYFKPVEIKSSTLSASWDDARPVVDAGSLCL